MTSPFAQKTGASRQSPARRTWRLVELNRNGAELRVTRHASLDALARAARKRSGSLFTASWYRPATGEDLMALLPLSPNGKVLALDELLAYASRLVHEEWFGRQRRSVGYRRRQGPVHGIRKWRGGGGSMRRPGTTAERRLNAFVLHEDGEVGCRPARRESCLPNAWDDYLRHKERSWKAQHKGRKSWDRG